MTKWYDVTFRGTAEMTVRVLADSPDEARMRAEDGYGDENYESQMEWVKGQPYTLKVRVGREIESKDTA